MIPNTLFRKRRPHEPVGVKICGVTVEDEAHAIIGLGADMLGFSFWPRSKRFLGRAEEAPWVRDLPVCRFGVFVDAPHEEIVRLWRGGWINFAQLHGDETPADCLALEKAGVPVVKAFGVRDEASLEAIAGYRVGGVLLDAYAPAEKGGTGETFAWDLARRAIDGGALPWLMLAGGLTPENVRAAVAAVRPDAVDVASGVESGVPGRKDLAKVKRFIEEAKGK